MSVQTDQPIAKPFLKWAGGKRQLLPQLEAHFPSRMLNGGITRYVEPFVGSGALFFKIFQSFPIEECLLTDINPELILLYKTIRENVSDLIQHLEDLEQHFLKLDSDNRKDFYYQIRDEYNKQRLSIQYDDFDPSWVSRSAQMLFLNRTGYNGLFRLNSKGAFNVPYGRYKNPRILDAENLYRAADLLQRVSIFYGDFEETGEFVDHRTLVYFDPPYRPISATAHFTAYSKDGFDDHQQLRLAKFYRDLDGKGASLMLSNSDPHNLDPQDDFLEDAYRGFRIERLKARRNINREADKRGHISELLILNYALEEQRGS
jgi:DNA adenine methylase